MVWLIAFGAGLAAVIQGGFNRQAGRVMDLSTVVLINGLVFLVLALGYWWWNRDPATPGSWSWWALFPGALGFLFVLAVPFAIARLGAMSVFICLIAAQISGGVLWDLLVEDNKPTPFKWIGAALTLAGALIMSRG